MKMLVILHLQLIIPWKFVFLIFILAAGYEPSPTESAASMESRSSSNIFESRNMSPDLLIASDQLSYCRQSASKCKRKLDRLQSFATESIKDETTEDYEKIKKIKLTNVSNGVIFVDFEKKIANIEERIKTGKQSYKTIMNEIESIRQERKMKDQGYTRKIANVFKIPINSVKDIIQACSTE
jgi:hypothetical protein